MASLDIYQQIFAFSVGSNSAWDSTGSAESLAQVLGDNFTKVLADNSTALGGNWRVVWGPVVWQAELSDVADNAMLALSNGETTVVAIAGTNPKSAYDIAIEDLAVTPTGQQDWPGVAGATLSHGSWVGIERLTATTSKGQTLKQYLDAQASTTQNLVFAGHSLGGGLTPAMALFLYPQGATNSGWASVDTFPTAGPTVGNAAFAAAFAANFPKKQGAGGAWHAVFNTNIYNTLDAVPQAWASNGTIPCLSNIDDLYSNVGAVLKVTLGVAVSGLTSLSTSLFETKAAAYRQLAGTPFKGVQQHPKLDDFAQLKAEALYQHISAYSDAIGVTGLFANVDAIGPVPKVAETA